MIGMTEIFSDDTLLTFEMRVKRGEALPAETVLRLIEQVRVLDEALDEANDRLHLRRSFDLKEAPHQ